MVAITDKEQKKLAEKHNKLLAELVKQPDNSTCADCGANGPRWASWNLGVFLCIRCGGAHRRIGTHISKVKSITLDNWTTEQIEHFRKIGNNRANAFFNPHPERNSPPRTDREVERYVRDKYERRLFVDHRNGVPDPTTNDAPYPMSPSQPASPLGDAPNEADALTRLREMGFMNVRDNHLALKRFSYNIEAAAAYLRGDSAPAKPKIGPSDPRVKQLLNMGFDHVGQNVQALAQCNGDLNQSIELLLSDNPPPRTNSAAGAQPATRTSPPTVAVSRTSAVGSNNRTTAHQPAVDLFNDDISGLASVAKEAPKSAGTATAGNATAGINDLLNGLSLNATSTSGSAPKPAQSISATNPPQDLFGDFGDFLSAPSTPNTQSQQVKPPATTAFVSATTTSSAPAPAPAATAPTSPSGQGAFKDTFDNDFIMSLYSKPAAQQQQQQQQTAGRSNGTAQQPAQASGNAFADLDLLF
ncbi:GTPase activator activity protein [Coemansia sp. BCRC 34490]|nr:GTPase activator activity protein [Coemansia sp. BCRC 34490]